MTGASSIQISPIMLFRPGMLGFSACMTISGISESDRSAMALDRHGSWSHCRGANRDGGSLQLRNAYLAMVASSGVPLIPGTRNPRDCGNHSMPGALPISGRCVLTCQIRSGAPGSRNRCGASRDKHRPTGKELSWGDFTAGMFENKDRGYETAILLGDDDNVTEGPGSKVCGQ